MTPFEFGFNLLKSDTDGNNIYKGRNIYEKAEDWPFGNKGPLVSLMYG